MTQATSEMKIPVLTAFALLALVGAYDSNADEDVDLDSMDDRRLGKAFVNGCWWKWPFWENGKCVKKEWCWDTPTADWKENSVRDIPWTYCWEKEKKDDDKSSSSSSRDGNKCRKWRKKYKQCKKKRSKSKVRTG